MVMIVNKLPSEVWKMNIPLACKVIAERICALTKNGEQECYISNAYISETMRLDKCTVQRSITTLIDRGIISTNVTIKNNKKVRLVSFIFNSLDDQENAYSQKLQNATIDSCKKPTTKLQNATIDNGKMQLSSIQSNELISNELSDDSKIHSPSTFSLSFSTDLLLSVCKEKNISTAGIDLSEEAEKFYEYYKEDNLTVSKLKVKALNWLKNCTAISTSKAKTTKGVNTDGLEGLIGNATNDMQLPAYDMFNETKSVQSLTLTERNSSH